MTKLELLTLGLHASNRGRRASDLDDFVGWLLGEMLLCAAVVDSRLVSHGDHDLRRPEPGSKAGVVGGAAPCIELWSLSITSLRYADEADSLHRLNYRLERLVSNVPVVKGSRRQAMVRPPMLLHLLRNQKVASDEADR